MPELPEVETVCAGLVPIVQGACFENILVRKDRLRLPVPDELAQVCSNSTVRKISRRAKYILMTLANGQVVIIHLGMSGRLVIHNALQNDYAKHDHIIFKLSGGKELVFNDPRRFGLVTYTGEGELWEHPLLKMLGVEPLEAGFTAVYMHDRLKDKKVPVKQALMDGNLVVGVGNIYACESLFQAGISPLRAAKEVSLAELELLVSKVKDVLRCAIAAGGSSLRDYVQSSGELGYFQHQFSVYGRQGQACLRCGDTVVRVRQAGRSTFYCVGCQK